MGVLFQAFYWDCPREDGCEFGWWKRVRSQIPNLASVGFTALWLPPPHKAANARSMGYDPYDYYDLGEFDQKGSVPTWFGTREELLDLIQAADDHGLDVLADMVINHNSGADAQEPNPIDQVDRWTAFRPKSGKFPRNWLSFHPSSFESWDEGTFGEMPDLSHRNPDVYGELLALGKWLIEDVGFAGFRFDFVKGYGSWTVTALMEYRYARLGQPFKPFGVGEMWDSARTIDNWIGETNAWSDNLISAFDFPLRDMLQALCDGYGFSLRQIPAWDTFLAREPFRAVTFVENHDLRDDGKSIVHDKLLAYAYILTHEGYPCVFWKDYFNDGLALTGTPNGIDALVLAHERYAGGRTEILWVDDDLYIMQRTGSGAQRGLVFALNNRGDRWNGSWVTTRWQNTHFEPIGWWSAADRSRPLQQHSELDGRAQFWAPPRGYAVYVPS